MKYFQFFKVSAKIKQILKKKEKAKKNSTYYVPKRQGSKKQGDKMK